MAKFKKGETVKVVVTVPEGPVEAFKLDEDGEVQYLVTWADAEGVEQSRWFNEADLVAV